jgi:hypothetical protein
MKTSRIVIGGFEVVSLPQLGLADIVAKVDTGAFSGAVHCTNIKIVRRGLARKRYLQFTPLGNAGLATETDQFLKTYIRSATGHRIKRYLIDTKINVQSKVYPIRIGLSDRSDMKRSVLIGRRFLRENDMLVDVRVHDEYDDEGENTR